MADVDLEKTDEYQIPDSLPMAYLTRWTGVLVAESNGTAVYTVRELITKRGEAQPPVIDAQAKTAFGGVPARSLQNIRGAWFPMGSNEASIELAKDDDIRLELGKLGLSGSGVESVLKIVTGEGHKNTARRGAPSEEEYKAQRTDEKYGSLQSFGTTGTMGLRGAERTSASGTVTVASSTATPVVPTKVPSTLPHKAA